MTLLFLYTDIDTGIGRGTDILLYHLIIVCNYMHIISHLHTIIYVLPPICLAYTYEVRGSTRFHLLIPMYALEVI